MRCGELFDRIAGQQHGRHHRHHLGHRTVHIDAEGHGRAAARTALGLDTAGIIRTPGRVIERGSA
ncbi:hypothetical protein [Streptomyces sp. NPDC096013]|uniref:hypothetical protein n=1 Tax=Streptomyces sp. NPDC096013 TaxID=3366069 RepID=UPI003817F7A9